MQLTKLSDKQKDFFAFSTHSFNIQSGSVSSGKTFSQTLRWADFVCNEAPNRSLLAMVGKTEQALYDNVVRDLIGINPNIRAQRQPLRLFYPKKQIEIGCVGADNMESWGRVQGKNLAGALFDEATGIPQNFMQTVSKGCRAFGKTWPKFLSCNPGSPRHYIMTDFIQNSSIDVRTWYFELDDNPILTDDYKNEIKSLYSGIYYDRYILGKWVLAEGSVFDELNYDRHIIDTTPHEGRFVSRYRALDWGYTNPFCCLWGALDGDGRLYVYDEHYQPKKLIEDHAKEINRRDAYTDGTGSVTKRTYMYTDADHDAQDNAEIRKHGIFTTNALKDVEGGIQKIKSRLKIQGDGLPRLFIDKNKCPNLIRELAEYHWMPTPNGKADKEEPAKINDHAVDALRYMCSRIDYAKGFGAVAMGGL